MLSVIIVNYNTLHHLKRCIASILENSTDIICEIIIIDNNSNEKIPVNIFSKYPLVTIFILDTNVGFARANNYAISQSHGDAVLLLNTDTLIKDNAIAKAYSHLMSSAHIACGVQLLNEDGSPQISGNYFLRGSINNLLPLPYLGTLLKYFGLLFAVKKPNLPDADAEVEVDWINGAFLMVKKDVIQKVGLLDEEFFLYAEEAEWCYRLRKEGTLCIYGDLHVVHLQGETSNMAFGSSGKGYYNLYDRKGLQIMLSNMLRIRKQNGAGWYLLHMMIYSFAVPVFWLVGTLEYSLHIQSFQRFLGLAKGFTTNILSLWTYFPKILFRRKYFYKVL